MDGTGPRQPLSDAQLDREVERALGVDPSPEFLARVRTRIAAEPGAVRWRLAVVSGFSRIFQRRAGEPLAAVAIVGIVLTVVVPRWMRDERPVARSAMADVALPSKERADLKVGPYVYREAGDSQSVGADLQVGPGRPPVVRVGAEGTTQLRLSTPLFSEDERRTLMTLVHAVEEGRVPPLPTSEASSQSGEMRELRIEPLLIEPLPQLARLEELGASQW